MGKNFHYLAPRYRRGGKFGGLLVCNKRTLFVRHLILPAASEVILGNGKGITQKVIPEKHTTNLERNLGENFTYYGEHKRLRILNLCCAIAAMSLGARDISLKACVASDVLRANPLIIGDVWGFGPMTSDALHAI